MFEEIENANGGMDIYYTDAEGRVWFVPRVEENADYQAYLATLTE